HHEASHTLAHMEAEFFGRHLVPRAQHDYGTDLFAQGGFGYPDDGAVGHGRVFEEGGLHLYRVHVLATANDHVLGPVDDVDEILVIEPGHVAGVEPSLRERLR